MDNMSNKRIYDEKIERSQEVGGEGVQISMSTKTQKENLHFIVLVRNIETQKRMMGEVKRKNLPYVDTQAQF